MKFQIVWHNFGKVGNDSLPVVSLIVSLQWRRKGSQKWNRIRFPELNYAGVILYCMYGYLITVRTRPSVDYTKEWRGQLSVLPLMCTHCRLVWSWKVFCQWPRFLGRSQQPYYCVRGHFDRVTNKLTNTQPGDSSASLPLTSEKAVFCNIIWFTLLWYHSGM